MQRILFLCTGNSCRSQMGEGFARNLKSDVFEFYSAGIEAHGLNPHAVRAMAEAGVDISGQASTRVVHRGFEDPPKLAREAASEEEAFAHYRRVRDEIRAYVEALPQALDTPGDNA